MKIVTIARNPVNSPNMTDKDAEILESVRRSFVAMGAEVIAIGEEEAIPEDAYAVCHMSRTPAVLKRLKQAEEQGIIVTNSPDGIKNCSRIKVMRILDDNGIPQPLFRIIGQKEELKELPYPAWIKRGEGWSCHKNDICYVNNAGEAAEAIDKMCERGISSFVYTRHCKGDIVKFYGIGNTYFTYCYTIADNTKFGLEKINGEIKHYSFDTEAMRRIAERAAKAVGLSIYGGDCIVDENGGISLIDLNDFPSFSPVRDEAAKEIAKSIMNRNI